MDLEPNFTEENSTYQLFNSTNHAPAISHSSEQHHAMNRGTSLPRHMAESSGLRRSASWGPYQHAPLLSEDWSSMSGIPLSRMASRSTSHFSMDTSQSSVHRELEEAKKTIDILQAKLETLT